ncbi:MAG: PD-(D/E)XK nuclease family protein [Deltaproteobacteria bacterium]|nr:PD-(D/E)XK nuclease family protein [Deltaproteobacteria bacterium]
MIRYLIGDTVDALQNLLDRKMASDEYQSILHLVPTRGRVIELEADHRFWLKRKINTVTGLIHHLFQNEVKPRRYSDHRYLDAHLRSQLIQKILERRSQQPDCLSYFSSLTQERSSEANFPGIYNTILRFFSMLVTNHLEDDFVNQVEARILKTNKSIHGEEEERFALESDLIWLLGDYEEIKRMIKGYDNDDILSHVRSFLEHEGVPSSIKNIDIIIFDGFIHLSRIEEEILFYLFTQVKEVWWSLDCDNRVSAPLDIFKISGIKEYFQEKKPKDTECIKKDKRYEAYRIFASIVTFMERLERNGIPHQIERATESIFLNPMARGFYRNGTMEYCVTKETLMIKSFSNRIDEVKGIAAEIKRIIHDEGLDKSQGLGSIRVIFSDLETYSPLLSEIFADYGIPFSLTRGLPVASHPITRIFIYIFEVALRSFQREDVFRLFSSDLIHYPGDNNDNLNPEIDSRKLQPAYLLAGDNLREVMRTIREGSKDLKLFSPDIFTFDQVAKKCGLHRLGDNVTCIGDREIFWVKDFYQDMLLHSRDQQEQKAIRQEYYSFLIQTVHIQQRLQPFLKMLHQDNPQNISELFFSILDDLGLPGNLAFIPDETVKDPAGANDIQKNLKRDIRIYSILVELIKATEKELGITRKFLFESIHGHDLLQRFYTGFKNRLSSAFLLDERNPNVIRVSQWLEVRGRAFDYIFAGGLTSDKFPFQEEIDFILSHSPSHMFRIPDPMDHSRYLFSHVLRNYRKRLYLSYPRRSEEKEENPSIILIDLAMMNEGTNGHNADMISLEKRFQWRNNPYYTSRGEILNASIPEKLSAEKAEGHLWPVNRIILRSHSKMDGLLRGIHSIISRWASDGLFEYDGLVSEACGFQAFLQKKEFIFSPSQLEALASCPMRYLFEQVYELKAIEQHGPEIPSKEMGQHIHAILKALFTQLLEHKDNIAGIGIHKAFLLADKVLNDYFSNYAVMDRSEFSESQKRDLRDGLDQDFLNPKPGSDIREGIIACVLRFEEKNFRDRKPQGLEYGFGYGKECTVKIGNSLIRGYIDRFDSDVNDPEKVYIYDYKSGRISSSSMIKKGLSFQLPIYMRALRAGSPFKKIAASFYSLNRDILLKENPLKQTVIDHCDDIKGLDVTGIRLIDDYVDQLLTLIKKGVFHHSEDETNCHHCEFWHVCHKDMRRMGYLVDSGSFPELYSGRKNLEKWKAVDDFRKKWKDTLNSMKKAFELKTDAGRKGHYDKVMRFKDCIEKSYDSLPFFHYYLDELIARLRDFQREYLSLKQ